MAKNYIYGSFIIVRKMTNTCPLCGRPDHLIGDDDMGEDGIFYSCHEQSGGCGATFRLTPDGKCVDLF
jgi:hypothetical protein